MPRKCWPLSMSLASERRSSGAGHAQARSQERSRDARPFEDSISVWGCGRSLLPPAFYCDQPDSVARRLLGKVLVRKPPTLQGEGTELAGRIVEVEAYFADDDPAAHSHNGKTPRNAVLFGPPGRAYVYFIYGRYFCLNVSCEPEGRAGCVLLRALAPLAGIEAMAAARYRDAGARNFPASRSLLHLASGPGRLCQAFGITRVGDNGADFTSPSSTLQIQDDGFLTPEILVTPRIGIRKAADLPARFLLPSHRPVKPKSVVA